MSILEQLESFEFSCPLLTQGGKARIKQTGQIVDLKCVSEHGISIVAFKTGGEYLMPNRNLEPVYGELSS